MQSSARNSLPAAFARRAHSARAASRRARGPVSPGHEKEAAHAPSLYPARAAGKRAAVARPASTPTAATPSATNGSLRRTFTACAAQCVHRVAEPLALGLDVALDVLGRSSRPLDISVSVVILRLFDRLFRHRGVPARIERARGEERSQRYQQDAADRRAAPPRAGSPGRARPRPPAKRKPSAKTATTRRRRRSPAPTAIFVTFGLDLEQGQLDLERGRIERARVDDLLCGPADTVRLQ